MVLQTVLNARSVVAVFGTGGILAGVLFLAAALCHRLGAWRSERPTHEWCWASGTLRSGTSQPSLVVAGQASTTRTVTVMIIVVTVVSMLILIPLTKTGPTHPPTPRGDVMAANRARIALVSGTTSASGSPWPVSSLASGWTLVWWLARRESPLCERALTNSFVRWLYAQWHGDGRSRNTTARSQMASGASERANVSQDGRRARPW